MNNAEAEAVAGLMLLAFFAWVMWPRKGQPGEIRKGRDFVGPF